MTFNNMIKQQHNQTNFEGGEAWLMSPDMELYMAVVTASLTDKFYQTNDERMNRIVALIHQVKPEFVAKLAVYTRTQMYLRSIPMLLLVELAKVHCGDSLVSRAVEQSVLRADEIMELLVCYQYRNPATDDKRRKLAKLSHQIQIGLQKAFNRFNEYQFAKYNRDNLEVKLRDALFLVHPKAKDKSQQVLFDKITSSTLETPYTWETELSAVGNRNFESKEEKSRAISQTWEGLITSGKLGYMALLRNLRNILQCTEISFDTISLLCSRLSDAQEIARSKQLPFRYYSAYKELMNVKSPYTSIVLTSLETAMTESAANIEGFDHDTSVLLACDVSGSMMFPISCKGKVYHHEIGLLLAMMLQSQCKKVVSGVFGDIWKVANMPQGNILANVRTMERKACEVGFSTNGYKVLEWLNEEQITVDKVLFFTDCQLWNSSNDGKSLRKEWIKYKEFAPQAKLYLFDMAGYGETPIALADKDVYAVAGWSDKIFDILSAIDRGGSAIEQINNTDI